MEVIVGKRGSGKTVEVIRKAAEKGLYIVCPTANDAERIAKQARKIGIQIKFPMTMGEFYDKQYRGKGIKGFIFDDIDRCLSCLTSVPVFGFSCRSVKSFSEAEIISCLSDQ